MTEIAAIDAYRAAELAARSSYGRLVALLSARDGDIAAAEDALSQALVSALQSWPTRGVPSQPDAWLLTAARNRLHNLARSQQLHRRNEPDLIALLDHQPAPPPDTDPRLGLMFVCAHPAIDPGARTPMMLQTVLGLDAATIARAFLVEPATMSQRLVRAKLRIRDAGIPFSLPSASDRQQRLDAVLDAIYAAFGQGWDSLDIGEAPGTLTGEAIWLARLIVGQMPHEPEPRGLLALMLYCDARRPARRDSGGVFVPLDRQDARLWNRDLIIEAEGLLTDASQSGQFGRYMCEAAIQSVHVQRAITGRLNLAALKVLYDLLVDRCDSIGARIGRAVVIAMAGDPVVALAELDALSLIRPAARVETYQPWWVARARVAALAGQGQLAAAARDRAIALTTDPGVIAFLVSDALMAP